MPGTYALVFELRGDVVKVDEQTVTVDLNHHLAGQALTFDIKVESISRE